MTSKEFVIWLKGFTEGVHEFNVTPKQWDLLKSKLEKINDYPYSISVGTGGYGTTIHQLPLQRVLLIFTNTNKI
jgi:hypothetical protein